MDPLAALQERFPDAGWGSSFGQDVVNLDRSALLEFGEAALETGFDMLADVTVVDWHRRRPTRFEVVINLVSLPHRRRLRILVPVPADDPVVPSLVGVWPGANFGEREAYDMYGVVFEGHPDLTRILMPDDWEGYPLRKDYGVGSVPVQFKESPKVS
jgi:NADH-quinone oxidoreductase subunit C